MRFLLCEILNTAEICSWKHSSLIKSKFQGKGILIFQSIYLSPKTSEFLCLGYLTWLHICFLTNFFFVKRWFHGNKKTIKTEWTYLHTSVLLIATLNVHYAKYARISSAKSHVRKTNWAKSKSNNSITSHFSHLYWCRSIKSDSRLSWPALLGIWYWDFLSVENQISPN